MVHEYFSHCLHIRVLQEFSTAVSCVLAVFPGCPITENRVDKYPIKVIVTAHVGGSKFEVWSGRQQDLFSKNGAKRTQTMNVIKANLETLKEDFE